LQIFFFTTKFVNISYEKIFKKELVVSFIMFAQKVGIFFHIDMINIISPCVYKRDLTNLEYIN